MKLFELGAVEISPAADAVLKANHVTLETLLSRHQQGDWGDQIAFDRQKNTAGVHNGTQLDSQYNLEDGTELYIATSGDRSATYIFLEADDRFEEVDTQKGYALWATTYDIGRNPLIEVEEGPVEQLLDGLSISSVLDVGTGTGRYAIKFARLGVHVTAIDASAPMLDLAKQKAAAENLNIDFRLAGWDDDLPYDASSFDLVVCALMLSHIPNLTQFAQKFHHLLQPDGHMLLTAFHPDVIAHGRRTIFGRPGITYGLPNVLRTRAEYLEILTAAGFKISRVVDIPLRASPPGIFPEKFIQTDGDLNFCLIILAQK